MRVRIPPVGMRSGRTRLEIFARQQRKNARFAGEQRKNPKYAGKEEMSMAEKGYIGRIQNSGVQEVKAPHQNKGKTPSGKVTRGTDLRTGKK